LTHIPLLYNRHFILNVVNLDEGDRKSPPLEKGDLVRFYNVTINPLHPPLQKGDKIQIITLTLHSTLLLRLPIVCRAGADLLDHCLPQIPHDFLNWLVDVGEELLPPGAQVV
jgi:hypothetical protein